VAERPDDFRFLEYSGLVVLTASLSESDPKATWVVASGRYVSIPPGIYD